MERFPLSWPVGWPRSRRRAAARFARSRTLATARDALLSELRLLGARADKIIISSNVPLRVDGLPRSGQAQPTDPGVAVYFPLKLRQVVLACDKWARVEDNLYAVAMHIGALRAQERYGVGSVDQAFAGYAALPPVSPKPWWEVLGLSEAATEEQVKGAFRKLALAAHPDQGGSADQLEALTRARHEFYQARASRGVA